MWLQLPTDNLLLYDIMQLFQLPRELSKSQTGMLALCKQLDPKDFTLVRISTTLHVDQIHLQNAETTTLQTNPKIVPEVPSSSAIAQNVRHIVGLLRKP